jgi:AcrR family transcriptional regulator
MTIASPGGAAAQGGREPQQARSRATRHRLLEATIEALVEVGYGRTTTTEVCARAGMSQGALFKHFGSKADLLAAATEHLFASLIGDYRRAFAAIAGHEDRIHAAVGLLWELFLQPRLQAVFELYTAARTDADLAGALAPVMAEHHANLHAEAAALFPEAAASVADFDAVVDVIVAALQGAALTHLAVPMPGLDRRRQAYLEALARRELGMDQPSTKD